MLIAKPPRSFDQATVITYTSQRQSGTAGSPGSIPPPTLLSTLYAKVERDVSFSQGYKNSDYYERLTQGRLMPMTPWTGYKQSFRVTNGVFDVYMSSPAPYYRYWITGFPYTWMTVFPGSTPPWYIDQQYLQNILNQYDARYFVQAAAAKIATSGWDTLTFSAELAKTVAMFRGFTSRLISLAKAGKLESLWLEGRYGWRTLIYDLKDIDKAIRNLNEGRKRFFDRVGTTISKIETRNDPQTAVYGNFNCLTTYTHTIGLRGSVAADIEPPRFQLNPLSTAWELTRLSFVVDWVVNVGQFLDSLSFLALQREYTAASGMMIKTDYKQTSSVNWAAGSSGQWFIESEGHAQLVVRIPASVSTIPLTELRLNEFKVLDLVALFIQMIGLPGLKRK